MNLRPFTFAAVTPLALPDISSKAIDGMYFITNYSLKKFLVLSSRYSAAVTIAIVSSVRVIPPVFILKLCHLLSCAGISTVWVTVLSLKTIESL